MSKQSKNTTKTNSQTIDNLLVVLCDLIIDSFITRQQTKGSKTRHTKEELKQSFRDSNSRLSKSERV